MRRFLEWLAGAAARSPWRFAAGTVAASLLASGLFLFLDLDNDISSLFPADDPHVRSLAALKSTAAGTQFALVVLTTPRPDPETLKAASDLLAARLGSDPAVDRVRWKVTEEERAFYARDFLDRAFRFLPPAALDAAVAKLTPEGMERELAACERLLDSPLPQVEERILRDPLNLFEDVFIPVLARRTLGAGLDFDTGHFLSDDGRAALLQVWGVGGIQDTAFARRFMDAVDRARADLRADGRFPEDRVAVGVTGGYPVALVNERSVKRNLVVSVVGAFAGVLLLFMAAFRSLRVNLTVGLPLALGTACAFGVSAPFLGFRMTAIAAAFGAILVGLGIDFPIHLVHRFREERAAGLDAVHAVRASFARTGPGVVSAGLTTVLAFGLLALADFRGMIEVGVFVALGMLALLAVMVTLLPALLVLVEGDAPVREPARFGLGWLEKAHGRAGPWLAASALVLTLLALADVAVRGGVPFETDVRRLRSPAPAADAANAAIGEHFGLTLNPVVVVARASSRAEVVDAAADAEALLQPLFEEGLVGGAVGPGAYRAGPLRSARARERLKDLDPGAVAGRLEAALDAHGFDPEAFRESTGRLRDALAAAKGPDAPFVWNEETETLLGPFLAEEGGEVLAVTALYMPQGTPLEVQHRATARAQELAGGRLGEGGVVTSMDLLVQRLKKRVLGELEPITGLVGVAVLLVALVHFRNPLWAFLALLPAASGFVLTLSAMKVFGISANFMNVVVFPMILGIGVDDGLHFVHRFREAAGERWREALHGAGMPIVMTSATSMAGFGSLVLADNAGLRSVGWVAILGLFSCMACTLLVLPALCRLAEKRRKD